MFEQLQSRRYSRLLSSGVTILIFAMQLSAVMAQAPTQPNPSAPAEAAIDEAALNATWDDLSSVEPLKAYRAAWMLAAAPQQAVEFIAKRLNVSQVDAAHVAKLIRDMDSDNYNTREAAKEDLANMGDSIEALLRQALKDKPSAEVASQLPAGPVTCPGSGLRQAWR